MTMKFIWQGIYFTHKGDSMYFNFQVISPLPWLIPPYKAVIIHLHICISKIGKVGVTLPSSLFNFANKCLLLPVLPYHLPVKDIYEQMHTVMKQQLQRLFLRSYDVIYFRPKKLCGRPYFLHWFIQKFLKLRSNKKEI